MASKFHFSLYFQYINTIGSHVKWQMLSPNKPLPPDFTYNFPADLKNVISYTTLKVLEGGNIPTLMTRNINELEKEEEEVVVQEPSIDLSAESVESCQYDRILNRPVVKKEDEDKKKERLLYEKPSLDISLPHVSFSYYFIQFPFLTIFLLHLFIDSHLPSPENSSYGSNQSTSFDTKRF